MLNYLGYSWIDQGINLDEGMAHDPAAPSSSGRTTATSSTRSAGPITARQLRRGGEAARARGRAQAGRPDHQRSSRRRLLAGRPQLEAHFQWAHARDLKPEPDELPKIEEKLKIGPAGGDRRSQADKAPPKKAGNGG